jgi:D-3-phosphoglycerate dehydrogenase
MPALSPEQFRTVGPFVAVAERLGTFAARIAKGQPQRVRLIYAGRISENNTNLVRNAGVAGVLNPSLERKANLINAMGLANDRGLKISERHEARAEHTDTVGLELETDQGTTAVRGAVLLGQPRLVQVDGIYCEAPLSGHLTFLKNADVPGVIGHVGSVLGRNGINIANFSLGRRDAPSAPGQPLEAIAVVETDQPVPEPVLAQLLENKAVHMARSVELER